MIPCYCSEKTIEDVVLGIKDTMKDLFVNLIGAVVFSIIGYFYVKKRGEGKFASKFIPKVKTGES